MTMLKTFDLKGNKLSFAEWISNLSPCETPFISMIGKEKIDEVQYSWQTDSLSKPVNLGFNEGSAPTIAKASATTVHTNFTQIYRKAVRVSDTTKKVSLYGRGSELAYQMEKAGMEIKRDLESALLNSEDEGRPGTPALHGIAAGVQKLVAKVGEKDADTDAVVHKAVTYVANAVKFTQAQVFDLTYNLYLVGSRANKVMVHPLNMYIFSDWVGANAVTPHTHRMFDGMDTKYNAHVSTFRDPLGQVFEIIPNRYMPMNQLFFFHEGDWTQMVLREPTTTELAKNGSSEKHMIEMEVGLRHRNPFASGILEFNQTAKVVVKGAKVLPSNIEADNVEVSTVSVVVTKADGAVGATDDNIDFDISYVNDDGSNTADSKVASVAPTVTNGVATAKATVKHDKGARIKVKASATADKTGNEVVATVDTYVPRD